MDLLIFAKWIFTAATQLTTGAHDWPLMHPEVTSPARITELHTEDPWTGTGTPVPMPPGKLRELFCLDRGIYTVEMRLGMLPTGRGPVDGRVWLAELSSPGAPVRTQLLMEFSAEGRAPTFQASAIGVRVEAWTCFSLRYDSTGPARVSPDPRYTFLTIRG